jgi:hypothetical protein
MAASSGHHGINSNLQQGSPPPCGFEERNAALLLLLATMAGQKEAHITASTNQKVETLIERARTEELLLCLPPWKCIREAR